MHGIANETRLVECLLYRVCYITNNGNFGQRQCPCWFQLQSACLFTITCTMRFQITYATSWKKRLVHSTQRRWLGFEMFLLIIIITIKIIKKRPHKYIQLVQHLSHELFSVNLRRKISVIKKTQFYIYILFKQQTWENIKIRFEGKLEKNDVPTAYRYVCT